VIIKLNQLPTKLSIECDIVAIDEAQFLGDELVPLVVRLADMGKRIIIDGGWRSGLGKSPSGRFPKLTGSNIRGEHISVDTIPARGGAGAGRCGQGSGATSASASTSIGWLLDGRGDRES
jgi:hypothetical protein